MKNKRFISLLALWLVICMFFAGCNAQPQAEDPAVDKYKSFSLGLLDEDPSFAYANMITMSVDTAALPSSYDNSTVYPTSGDQGGQGSCVGWATTYALKSTVEMVGSGGGRYDDNTLFSPAFTYNQINGGEDAGSVIGDAFMLLYEVGALPLADFPYSDRDYTTQPTTEQLAKASQYRIKDFYCIEGINEIKQAIYENYGVVVGINVYDSFYYIEDTSYVYQDYFGEFLGGHAICLVGYDDNLQAFKFINSWGDDWMLGGYAYVSYQFAIDRTAAYCIVPDTGPDPTDPDPDDPDPYPTPNPNPDDPDPTPGPGPGPTSETYSIRFNANGGAGDMPEITGTIGEGVTLPRNMFTYDGADFAGWIVHSSGYNGWLYSDGYDLGYYQMDDQPSGWELVSLFDQDYTYDLSEIAGDVVTLKAQWEADDGVYTVRFDPNGGSGQMTDMTAVYGAEWRLPNNQFVKEGAVFAGWQIYSAALGKWIYENNGELVFYAQGEQPSGAALKVFKDAWKTNGFSPVGNDTVVLYAVWETGGDYTINYNGMGGVGAMSSETARTGAAVTPRANAYTKQGSQFSGWYVFSGSKRGWLCSRGDEMGYFPRNERPSDWNYVIIGEGESKVIPNIGPSETLYLCAYWK